MAGKWTKGPWRVEPPRFFHSGDHTLTSVEIAAGDPEGPFRGNICYAQSCEQIGGIYGGEVMANARLIAQAPAMAEALGGLAAIVAEMVADSGGCDHSVGICLCAEEVAVRRARAILAAIKGDAAPTGPCWPSSAMGGGR